MSRLLIALLLTTVPATAAPAGDTETKREYSPKDLAKLQSLTPEHFRSTAVVTDDALEPIAVITTDEGFFSRGRFTDRVRSDNFFRALVDKTTGETRFQLYAEVNYNFEWRNFESAAALLRGKPQAIPLTVIERKVVTCMAGACSYREAVAIPLREDEVREIATPVAGAARPWSYRLKAQNGRDFEDAIMPAEAAGFLLRVDEYRRAHALPSGPSPNRN